MKGSYSTVRVSGSGVVSILAYGCKIVGVTVGFGVYRLGLGVSCRIWD
jgi:hypothetical protein